MSRDRMFQTMERDVFASNSPEAIEQAVHLSARYLNERKLPDKAIDILDEIGAAQNLKINKKKIISSKEVEDTVAKIARIPSKNINREDNKVLKNLTKNLKLSVFGQDKAITELSRVVRLSRSGLREKEKTIGSYLFAGPTGVGKTEIARVLANVLNVKLLRFDMSEYMERHSVSKLIGAPPGYVGYDQGGQLTDAIDKSPFSVVLLDEVEKAHPDVFNILLQIMDYGRLTDHMGKRIDFTNVILIMTSNVGASQIIKEKVGFLANFTANDNEKEINSFFSPEFRNRLDAIINFDKLGQKESIKIVEKFLMELESQLVDKDLTLNVTASAKNKIQELGFDVINGARPMARVIQEKLKIPLSEILLKTKKPAGTIYIDYNNKSEKFSIKVISHKNKIKLST